MTVATSTLTEVASGLAFPESPIVCGDGTILVSEVAGGCITRVHPGGLVERAAMTGGGPNGIALFGDGLVVCQNGGSSWGVGPWPYDLPGAARVFRPLGASKGSGVRPQLQRVDGDGAVSTLGETFRAMDGTERSLVRPSDVCADGAGGFYFTDGGTSHGRSRELTGLLHGTPSGELTEIMFPLEMPNGVALSPDGAALYVAETRTRRVWRFDVESPGVLSGGRGFATVPSGGPLNIGGADGLCVTPDGCVVVATLGAGGVTVFDSSGVLLMHVDVDDPMTTNAAFDTANDRLVMSLASSGRLIAVEKWSELIADARQRVAERKG